LFLRSLQVLSCVKDNPAFYVNQSFITAFTRSRRLRLFWAT